jgi:predicted 3-demethylubiquinone-9 3-methyltransferase (glyoxalase superfamily)
LAAVLGAPRSAPATMEATTMVTVQRVSPCLWFDDQAEAAVDLYTSTFPASHVVRITHYGASGREIHGRVPGSVMTIDFEIFGQRFTALNGGPAFRFNEAISLQVFCDTQKEIDDYWSKLSRGGDPAAQRCGWLKDRFGLSWQIVPRLLADWVSDPESAAGARTFAAMLAMKKLDLGELERAHAGDGTPELAGLGRGAG